MVKYCDNCLLKLVNAQNVTPYKLKLSKILADVVKFYRLCVMMSPVPVFS